MIHFPQEIGCSLSVVSIRERRNVAVTHDQVYRIMVVVVPKIETMRGREDNAVIGQIFREVRVNDGILKVVVSTGVQTVGNSYQFIQRMGKFFLLFGECVELDVVRQMGDLSGDLNCIFDVHFLPPVCPAGVALCFCPSTIYIGSDKKKLIAIRKNF